MALRGECPVRNCGALGALALNLGRRSSANVASSLVKGKQLLERAEAMMRIVSAAQWLGPTSSVLLPEHCNGQHQKSAFNLYMKSLRGLARATFKQTACRSAASTLLILYKDIVDVL